MDKFAIPGDKDPVKIVKAFDEIDKSTILIIILAAWLLLKASEKFFPWLAERFPARFRFYILPMVPILRLLIIVSAVVLLIPEIIHPKFENLIAILGALGLALGFAFKDYISSLTAGLVAVYEHPYRPGDWIRIGQAYGEVKSVQARSLRMLTLDDELVTIPHQKIWDSAVFNSNDARRELMCIADFYLHPRHDAALVRQKLVEVALSSPYLQLSLPVIVVVSEEPWYTHYRLKAYPVEGRDQLLFISDLTIRGKAAMQKIGVEPAIIPTIAPLADENKKEKGRGKERKKEKERD